MFEGGTNICTDVDVLFPISKVIFCIKCMTVLYTKQLELTLFRLSEVIVSLFTDGDALYYISTFSVFVLSRTVL